MPSDDRPLPLVLQPGARRNQGRVPGQEDRLLCLPHVHASAAEGEAQSADRAALAPIALCRIHGPNNPVCPEKSYYRWLVQEWGKVLPELYDRGYWFNLADPGFPFPMMHCLREQIPLGKELGIKGWRVETLNHWAAESPSLYVAAKLMWNHRADVDALVRDYCERFFGPAGKPMQQYVELMNAAVRDADFHTGSSFDMPHIYPQRCAFKLASFSAEAGRRAGSGLYRERVRIVSADFDYLEAFIAMLDHRARHHWAAAKADLDQIDRLREQLLAVKPPMLNSRAATSYLQRFFRVCTEQGYAARHGRQSARRPACRPMAVSDRSQRDRRRPGLVAQGSRRRQLAADPHIHVFLERPGVAPLQGLGVVPADDHDPGRIQGPADLLVVWRRR